MALLGGMGISVGVIDSLRAIPRHCRKSRPVMRFTGLLKLVQQSLTDCICVGKQFCSSNRSARVERVERGKARLEPRTSAIRLRCSGACSCSMKGR